MDPDETLRILRAYVTAVNFSRTEMNPSSRDWVEAFGALDDWLTAGGFLPQSWARPDHG